MTGRLPRFRASEPRKYWTRKGIAEWLVERLAEDTPTLVGIDHGFSLHRRVYPSLWSRGFANEGRTADQHDAFCIAAWASRADRDGSLEGFLKPDLSPAERTVAQVEGWILGVPGLIRRMRKLVSFVDRTRVPSALTLAFLISLAWGRLAVVWWLVEGREGLVRARLGGTLRVCSRGEAIRRERLRRCHRACFK